MDYGIDVSGWNEVTDWAAVRGNNISFASVKVTQGDYYLSPSATRQIQGARAAGVAVGGYHFADPRIPMDRQVSYFVDQSRQRGVFEQGSFAPMVDVEDSPSDGIHWSAGSANAYIPAFIHQLRDRTGVAPVSVYASLSFWRSVLRPDQWADDQVYLWIAVFNGDPGNVGGYQHRRAALHQHTAEGNVTGVRGHVDRNVTINGFTVSSLTIGNVTPPSPGPAPQPVPTPGGWVDYPVQPGDTLSAIAAARGTSVDELVRVNSISNPDLVYVGQVIRVPASGGSDGGGGGAPSGQYRVQPGDTLSAIAARFGTTVEAIAAANGIADPDLIYVGAWLDIPAGSGAPTGRVYVVQSGDTLSGIAQQLGTTVGHLVSVNGITNADLIFPGQALRY